MGTDRKIQASLPPAPPPAPLQTVNAFPQARPMHGRTSGPTRRSTRGQWTHEEDEILRAAVQRFKGKNWKKIAECFKDRTDVQCLHRWQKVLNPDLIKGPWSKEEDEIIVQLVKKYGPKKWSTISQHLPGRIGKQCRERWHNHLNPGIKKEAWTQEEELVLIHVHQHYGNKWAELTKYLPGRTDNSIKNHWNSSVKKKLDSYKASGLLAQFQGLPLVSHQNQSMSFGDGAEGEEMSEYSQAGCSQTPSDMSNAGCQTREDILVSEESDQGKIQSTSPAASCSEPYYTSLDDMTFTIPDIPCEFTCSSYYLDENFSNDQVSSARDCNIGESILPMNSSVDLAADSSQPANYYLAAPNHKSSGYSVNAPVNNSGEDPNVVREEGDANVERCSNIIDMEKYKDYMCFQSLSQFSEAGEAAAFHPYNHLNTIVLEASNNGDLSSIPSELFVQNGLTMTDEQLSNTDEGHVHARINANPPCHDPSGAGSAEKKDLLESSGLIPENNFNSEISDDQQRTPPRAEQPGLSTCGQEVGTLCYEPPRFPSLDIPFLSCDLAQCNTDAQQDFSPLGIRRFIMSSASSLTPLKLWDSPSSVDSPDALLKSAAKTFACTPSILKKRNRDLLSPLSPFSERRIDKKTGKDVSQGFLCSSRLTREFSRLDVIFGETVQCKESSSLSNLKEHQKASIEDKENIFPAVRGLSEDANHNQEFEARTPEKDTHTHNLHNIEKGGTPNAISKTTFYEDCAFEKNSFEQPKGVLVERNINDTEFLSPDGSRRNTRPSEVDSSKYTSKKSTISISPICSAGFFVSPSSFDNMKLNNGSEASSSGQPISAVTTVIVDSLVNEVGAENLNFFGGTPFRRSMESPSAWKSPWYFSSLVSCPRFEPDITIEDIGIFLSPGESSFDAIGLMKEINDQGADAYADAREVLGSETPDSILRQRCSKKLNLDGEMSNVSDSLLKGHLHMSPNVMTEGRVLDFSECNTPVKMAEKMRCAGAASLSNPSLLRSFR
ncbi:transcription factor MYB3R-1 [Silene latifolia]|uniref:transcription factor MYB3R-1 n=1 Tax=Silene latifolia TaxID=37657 RepID=UPI003D786955